MAIYHLLKNQAFGPSEITVMTSAYEDLLRTLGLKDRFDPITRVIAQKLIACAQGGERDPIRLRDQVLETLKE